MQHEAKQCISLKSHWRDSKDAQIRPPPPENMSALKSAIKGGMKSKEMHSYFVCFVEKMPAPLARMIIYRWRHALLTRLSTSHVLTGLQ